MVGEFVSTAEFNASNQRSKKCPMLYAALTAVLIRDLSGADRVFCPETAGPTATELSPTSLAG